MGEKENIIIKIYDIILYAIPLIGKFPRDQKFIIGDRFENELLDILEMSVEAYYTDRSNKLGILKKVNIKLEKTRYIVRLCNDLKLISQDRYGYLSERLNEIGKMVGGWIQSVK
jgi:hypothetical protein